MGSDFYFFTVVYGSLLCRTINFTKIFFYSANIREVTDDSTHTQYTQNESFFSQAR